MSETSVSETSVPEEASVPEEVSVPEASANQPLPAAVHPASARAAAARPAVARRASTGRLLATALLVTALAIGGTFLLDPYRNYQLALVAATFCATGGLTLLIGLSGQLSLGHAALMAAGGYGYALAANAVTEAGVDGVPRFLIGMAGAIAASGALGLLLGLAGARLRGPYLAGVTLAVVIALPAVTAVFPSVFRGDQGVQIAYSGVPEFLKLVIVVEQWQAWVAILVTAVVVTWLAALRRGRLGLRMRAVHGDETAARLAGVPTRRVKVQAFAVSAVAAGAGGALLCFIAQSVSPGAYTLAYSLLLVVAVVVGGLGSLGGALAGAVVVVLLPWVIGTLTAALALPSDLEQRLSGNLPVLVFGALLIVVMAAWPGGLAGAVARVSTPARGFSRRVLAALGRSSTGGAPQPVASVSPEASVSPVASAPLAPVPAPPHPQSVPTESER
ncbi:ABC transporter permease subunit [Agromyces larvae]|uniref:Branched-chain amino acid ABC transporter permease n=1 Tax=Agromyces larvae TaxID=2929802 RepID=A0ABY4BUJ2_9MICO|nr:branched-chain amino acid ABC transporter permease [Agromyces larvae]UOE42844.1 branched-chain amino acid ABC transporter permease [Agromyces larvae]